ncbi:MAG TPA: TIM44-like domain-containing protein [Solirubrobacteraceae bacterium]|jgi:predicted lipid-binding transport protein (Tim44 family)
MNRKRLILIILAVLALALLIVPAAMATAGGGSSGFGGGGGGGGEGGGGGHGSGFALYILINLLIRIALLGHGLGALVLIGLGLIYLFFTKFMPYARQAWENRSNTGANSRRRVSQRQRRVELAAAEAAEDDPVFAPENVRSNAKQLFLEIQKAWDANDRIHLRGLVGTDLMAEWERRLDDFDRRGWRNHVEPLGEPSVEYVGLTHKGDPSNDRIVVRIEARIKDYVIDRSGRRLRRSGRLGETTRIREYWTLQRRGEHWVLASIQQGAEGRHALDEQIVGTPWADERGMRDEALIEGAVADAVPEGTKVSEIAALQFEGDAHSAANDLSLADGRFSPDVLEIAARRAVDAWALAVDGDDGALKKVATGQATQELLYAGDTSRQTRLVVRGPAVKRIRIVGLDAAAEPPTMTVEVDLTGRRYLEDRDTAAVVAGSRSRTISFTERWTLSLNGDAAQPWRITAVGSPVGLA